MAYTELFKNFNRIRGFMQEFYVYGFRSREEFERSGRTYDNERRRIETWLGDFMRFRYTSEGKAIFFSIDSRRIPANPFFQALRAKSFTDGDICLHCYLLSLLASEETRLTAGELLAEISALGEAFAEPPIFDESTLRKKLKEYCELGVLRAEKQGNKLLYRRAESCPLPSAEALGFFSEVLPCGALSYYLIADMGAQNPLIRYKHHDISSALESEVLYGLFCAIGERREAEIVFRGSRERIVPLAIYVGTRTGRRYLAGRSQRDGRLVGKRLDHIVSVKTGDAVAEFAAYREQLREESARMWGVSFGKNRRLGKVCFRIRIGKGEEYVYKRLEREKRCGFVTRIDEYTAEFCAEVYDANEMIPWIRTFLGRIISLDFSDRTAENRLKKDFFETCSLYGIGEDV